LKPNNHTQVNLAKLCIAQNIDNYQLTLFGHLDQFLLDI
jgi:hypothetical protein